MVHLDTWPEDIGAYIIQNMYVLNVITGGMYVSIIW